MKKATTALLTIFLIAVFASVVSAQDQDATDSARRSKASERAKDRLEQLKARRTTGAAEIREKIRDKFRRRAHVFGEITAISGITITIQTKLDTIKTIFTNDETKLLQIGAGGKKKISLSEFKVGDKIAAVGIAKDEDSGLAKYVVKLTRPAVRRHALFGRVSSISDNTLALAHLTHSDRPAITVNVNSDTKIKIRGKEDASLTDVKVDDKVAVSGTVNDKGVITVKRLFVIPGKFEGVKPKEATKSATPSSTTQ